jgi:hypothetical protein
MAWAACGKASPAVTVTTFDDAAFDPAVAAAVGHVPGWDVLPGQRPQLAEQTQLVALDGDQVVRAALVQPGGVLALGMQCVRSDQHATEVGHVAEQAGEHSDLIRLAAHGGLGEHHPGAVVEAGQQVGRGDIARACAAHGLAVHSQHYPPAWPPSGQLRGHP